LQSFITKSKGWRNWSWQRTKSKKAIKVATTKDNQLHTPISKDLERTYRSGRTNSHWQHFLKKL
jgi:hypothetical protein